MVTLEACPPTHRHGIAPQWAYDRAWELWLEAEHALATNADVDPSLFPLNYFYYCQTILQVEDKQTQLLIPFRFKPVQLRVAVEIIAQWLAGLPVRLIILKARREGVSTVIQAFLFWVCVTKERRKAFTIAHDDETGRYLHMMSETYYDNLPSWCRPMRGTAQRGMALEFANPTKDADKKQRNPGLQSWLRTVSLKNAGAGQGAALLHLSEVALWDPGNAAKSMNTVLKVVPLAALTFVAMESTARGIGNLFHRMWTRAEMGVSDYTPIFIGWHEEPTNTSAHVPDNFQRTDDEDELAEKYELTDGQLWWRRQTIENECFGDLDNFNQEYPIDADEAFLASGRPYFPARQVQRYAKAENPEPAMTGHLEEVAEIDGDTNSGRGWSVFTPATRAYTLRVWEAPEDHEDYLIFGDAAGGKPDAEIIEASGRKVPSRGDWHATYVFKRSKLEIVAAWHGKVDRDEYGDHLYRLGKWYAGCTKGLGQRQAGALVAVEVTGGWGQVPLSRLKWRGYPRIYRRPIAEDEMHREQGDLIGWDTSIKTRPLALDSLKQAIRTGELVCPDRFLFQEAATFVYDDTGKPGAMPGCFDDRVLAAAGGCYLWHTSSRRHVVKKQPPRKPRSEVTGV